MPWLSPTRRHKIRLYRLDAFVMSSLRRFRFFGHIPSNMTDIYYVMKLFITVNDCVQKRKKSSISIYHSIESQEKKQDSVKKRAVRNSRKNPKFNSCSFTISSECRKAVFKVRVSETPQRMYL